MSDSLPVDEVFACNLLALDTEARQRHSVVCKQLFESFQEIRELPEGYGFRWGTADLLLGAEFISRERLCCPFFDFTLSVDARADSFWLDITGRPGTKAFVRSEFGMVFPPDGTVRRPDTVQAS